MSGYTKLFSGILDSTIWREDDRTRILWITMLAMADRDGNVKSSIPGLADRARISIEDCESGLERFQQADKYSTSQDEEGRRIRAIDGGWMLINHSKYRTLMSAEDQREKARIRKQNQRTRAKCDMSRPVTPGHECHDIAEAKAKADTKARKSKAGALSRTFAPPSLDEVIAYCKERRNRVQPQKWLDHYQANGWRVGRNQMKDWRASIRTWESHESQHLDATMPQPAGCTAVTRAQSQCQTYNIPPGLDAESGESAWNSAKEMLACRINKHSFETWLMPVKAVGSRDGKIYLTLPSRDFEHVQVKFGKHIQDALNGLHVEYLIPEEPDASLSIQ